MRTHGIMAVLALLGLALLTGGCGGGGGGGGITLPTPTPTPPPSGKPTLTITATDSSAGESSGVPNPGMFRISRTGETTSALTVSLVVEGSLSNLAGLDFDQAPLGDTIVIPAGAAAVEIAIDPVDDGEVEGAEVLIIRLFPNEVEYTLVTEIEASVSVFDDDAIVLDIDVAAAKARVDAEANHPHFQIIDVRTPPEFAGGHLENAINIDLQAPDFSARIEALDPAGTYLIYCMGGSRSAQARDQMELQNLREILNMLGGISAWAAAGYPVVTD